MYFIDAPELQYKARKPKYVDDRFKSMNPKEDKAKQRRVMQLVKKQRAIKQRYESFYEKADAKVQQEVAKRQHYERKLEQSLKRAEKKRKSRIEKTKSKARQHNDAAKSLAKETAALKAKRLEMVRQKSVEKGLNCDYRRLQVIKGVSFDDIKQPSDMARIIQMAWWRYKAKTSIEELSALLPWTSTDGFEYVMAITQNQDILSHVEVFLSRMAPGSPKVFITAFMLHHYASQMFSTMGPDETRLKTLASRLVTLCGYLMSDVNILQFSFFARAFQCIWHTFQVEFDAWKKKDQKVVLQVLIDHFLTLSRMFDSVKDHPNASTEFQPELYEQQFLIFTKIKAIAPADGKDILTKALKAHGLKKVPRVTSQKAATPQEEAMPIPSFITNTQLSHEILVDPGFSFKTSELNEERELVIVRDILANEASLMTLLVAIRDALVEVAPHNGPHREFISRMLSKDQFDTDKLEDFRDFVVGQMLEFAAPMRDEAIKSIFKMPIDSALIHIQHTISSMRADLLNFKVHHIRTTMRDNLVQYEQKAFQESTIMTKAWLEQYDSLEDGFIGLLNGSDMPETFYLDEQRIKQFRQEMNSMVTLSAVYNMVKIQYGCTREQFEVVARGQDIVAALQDVLSLTNEQAEGVMEKSLQGPLQSILKRRLGNIIKSALRKGDMTANLTKVGLEWCSAPLKDLCHRTLLVFELNRQVHGSLYASMSKN